MNTWQLIRTAPKDGTKILTVRADEGIIEITQWYRLERDEFIQEPNGLFRKERRVFSECWDGNGHRATHWMPLPEPPEPLAESETDRTRKRKPRPYLPFGLAPV